MKAPACALCGWWLHLRRIASLLIMIALIVPVAWFLWPLVPAELPRIARRLIMMVSALLCLAPYFLWKAFFPPPFGITSYSDSVDYEFRDMDMACEFAQLNEDADWVKLE